MRLLGGQGGGLFDPGDLDGLGQGHPYSIGFFAPMRYIFGVNLVKIHSAVLYLLCGQGSELFDPVTLKVKVTHIQKGSLPL
jgi:hypothetical protein